MNLKRRSSARLSVEGSPVLNPEFKRLDNTTTPLKGRGSLGSYSSNHSATPQLVLRIKRRDLNFDQVVKDESIGNEVQEEKTSEYKQVLIIPSHVLQ